jgi:hypothetical protein
MELTGSSPAAPSGQLRFFQVTTIVLAALLLGAIGYYIYRQHQQQPVTVLVNGSPVATVESLSAATNLVQLVHSQQVGAVYLGKDNPRFTQDVEFQRTSTEAQIDSLDAAAAKLSAATQTVVDADVIVVNQKPIVALPDALSAQAAVDELRSHYASMPPDAMVVDKPSFVQTVMIDRRIVAANLAKPDPDSAATVLWTPPPPRMYTVEFHDTGWTIARKFKLSFADFLRANAGRDVNRLAPGDTVVVSKTFPPVDVIVKKREQENQKFGGSGIRQLTVEATYLDGQLVGTPIAVDMITVQRATPSRALD